MKLQLANPPRPWMRHRWLKRSVGTFVIPKAADRHPPGVHLNRYPHEVIGLWVSFGRQRYLSWVWPIRITGLRLTGEQFDRGVRDVTDNQETTDGD